MALRIVLFVLLILVFHGFFLWSLFGSRLRHAYEVRNLTKVNYRVIRPIVDKQDYRLINEIEISLDAERKSTLHFDHMIFGEKYIYLIVDKFWWVGLGGKRDDDSWVYYKKSHKGRIYIDNPLKMNALRKEKFSLYMGMNPDLFIPIILVNNDCVLEVEGEESEDNFIIHRKKLKKLLKELESRDVSSLNDDELQQVVYAIHRKNRL